MSAPSGSLIDPLRSFLPSSTGTVKHGVITTGASLMLGPDPADGSFRLTAIKSIHYKRLPVTKVGRMAGFGVRV